MVKLASTVVKRILRDVAAPGVVLLRGAASIIDDLPQNDIDLYISLEEWGGASLFGKHQPKVCRRSGLDQFRVVLEETESGILAELDIFQEVTWRGLRLLDIEALPASYVEVLGIRCLSFEAEAWLTVLKNALHGSPTPNYKLESVKGMPAFIISKSLSGKVSDWLQRQLEKSVWAAAYQDSPSLYYRLQARCALIGIRFMERPVHTVWRMSKWFIWRIYKRFWS